MGQTRPVGRTTVELHFGCDLARGDVLDRLQRVLGDQAPSLAARLRAASHEGDRSPVPIDATVPGDLRRAVIEKGAVRGPLHQDLVREAAPVYDRRFGHVLLIGEARSTFLTVDFDQYEVARPRGRQWSFSNTIVISTGLDRIERRPAPEWMSDVARAVADHPGLLWGAGYDDAELRHRNLDETAGMVAIGRDVRASLPGVFWLNLFGRPYLDLIGRQRVLGAHAHRVVAGEHLVMVQAFAAPDQWRSAEGARRRARLITDLGPEHFFDRDDPHKATRAPDLGLAELDPPPPLRAFTSDGGTFTTLPLGTDE